MSKKEMKRKLQKPADPNKPKKEKTTTINNIAYLGDLEVKNSALNQAIRKLFQAANNGDYKYVGYLYGSIVEKLDTRGLIGIKRGVGNFSQQFLAEISWKHAFLDSSKIDLNKIDKNDKEELLRQYLPQLLYITTERAIKRALNENESNECR